MNQGKCNILYDIENRIVVWQPLQSLSDEDWQGSFKIAMAMYKEKAEQGKEVGWLNDTRLVAVASQSQLDWLIKECTRLFTEVPVPKLAFVQPEKLLSAISVITYMMAAQMAHPQLRIAFLQNEQEAKEWLLKGREDV